LLLRKLLFREDKIERHRQEKQHLIVCYYLSRFRQWVSD
jgi:hypothetical protein